VVAISGADDPLAVVRTVKEAAQSGDLARAVEQASAALANGLEHPLLYNVAAFALEQDGRLTQACALLEKAVQMAPQDVGSRNALGLCLLRLERAADALEQFAVLLQLNPSLPFAYVSHGNALLALGRIGAAEASFQRALAIDANHVVAQARLANIAASRGAYADARAWAQKALAGLPNYPDAVMSLAAAELGERRSERALVLINTLLADQRLSPLERAHASGLLGDVLDAERRTAEAFAAYTTCNEALRRLYAADYDVADNAFEYVHSTTRYFERARPALWKAPIRSAAAVRSLHTGARGHVFVLGFPRSGTTLLEVILEGHPDVVSLEEKDSLIDGVREFMRRPDDLDRLAVAPQPVLEALRASYWQRVAAAGVNVDGKVFVDKYPLNSLKLPLISRLFPEAKILFACRDPRDVVLSCFRHRFRMSAPLYEVLSIDGAARFYDAVMGLVVRLSATLTLDLCLVRHEDVVTEFAREMKRICGVLNLEWAPAMGDFALRTRHREVLTPSTAQLVRGLNTEGLGQWRRYRAELAGVLPLLDPWVKRFFYEA
jgi:tetratricopeptide (TPR) repeat protein